MQRAGIILVLVGLLAVSGAYAFVLLGIVAAATPWWFAFGTTAVLAGMAVLGASRRGRTTPVLTATVAASFTSVLTGLLVPLGLPVPDATDPLLLGLPYPTAILLLLVGLVPLVLLPIAYAYAFDREVLSDDDLAALRDPSRAAARVAGRVAGRVAEHPSERAE